MNYDFIISELKQKLNFKFDTIDYENGNVVLTFEKKFQILPFIKIDKINNNVKFAFFNTYRIDCDLVVNDDYFLMIVDMNDNMCAFICDINNYLTNLYSGKWIEGNYYNIFVYGTLKRGYKNSYLTFNSIRNSKCSIKGTMYDTGYGYPALTLNGDYIIQGQLISIPKEYLIYYDQLEGYPEYYDRKVIEINVDGVWEKAFVYTMQNISLNRFMQPVVVQSGTW